MAFGYPSVQTSYFIVSQFDPALDLPELPQLSDEPSADDVKAFEAIAKERSEKYDRAHVTGDWKSITKPGDQPTMFKCRQIHGTALTWMQGHTQRHGMGADEAFELALRLALREVLNFGALKLEFETVDGQKLVKQKSLEPLYSIGRDVGRPLLGRSIVLELGGAIWKRALEGVSPLS